MESDVLANEKNLRLIFIDFIGVHVCYGFTDKLF